MDEKLPIRLAAFEPCKESTAELRFASDIPSEAILGFVYQKLQSSYSSPKSLPIMQLPQDVRERDPNLHFAPYHIMENDSFQINIGPRVIAIINRTPYVGWEKYSAEIKNVLTDLNDIKLFKTISRLGVRYVNFFDKNFDMLSSENINLVINSPFEEYSNVSYSTLVLLQDLYDGYSLFSFIRASLVLNCQSTTDCSSFLTSYHSVTSFIISSFDSIR